VAEYWRIVSRIGLVEAIGGAGVVVGVRASDAGLVRRTATALAEGGVRAVELPFDGSGEERRLVQALKNEGLTVGVGGITRAPQAREVGMLGADFVATAVAAPDVVAACGEMDLPCILSGLTPTEVWRALEMGADFVKVRAEVLGGPRYISSLLEALPVARRLIAAEVPIDGYLPYLEAGAEALEFGCSLVHPGLIEGGEWAEISRRASKVVNACDEWKANRDDPDS
jgi:2-dehydro-3-deoxyphosphogluconate aldolase / (4S)-4-hydroxy-2-oxoglutarate aldolase